MKNLIRYGLIIGIISLIFTIGCEAKVQVNSGPQSPKQQLYDKISRYNMDADFSHMVSSSEDLNARYSMLPDLLTVVVYPSNSSIEEEVFKAYPFFGTIESVTEAPKSGVSVAMANGGSGVVAGGDAKASTNNLGYIIKLRKNPVWNQ